MNAELLNLPWQIQVSLGSGYAAYVLAYIGLRDRHRPIDTALITLAFGLIATAVLFLVGEEKPGWGSVGAFAACCISGMAWRKLGRPFIRGIVRSLDISWMDDDPSALATLSSNTQHHVTQIAVQLDDGTWLRCDDVSQFSGAPFAPFLLGPNGDVALYLTHEGDKEQPTTRNADYGDRITYIPASRVRCINIRQQARS